jgi:hypothetical protein
MINPTAPQTIQATLPIENEDASVSGITERRTGVGVPILSSWPAWGTLAFEGFKYPSFKPAHLVELECADVGEPRARFGFFWEGQQHDAVVLHWLKAQRRRC